MMFNYNFTPFVLDEQVMCMSVFDMDITLGGRGIAEKYHGWLWSLL